MLLLQHLVLITIASSLMLAQPVVQTPRPTGTYPVGRTLLHLIDEKRIDPVMDGDPVKRELIVVVWYPAVAQAKAAPAPWMPEVFLEGQTNIFAQQRRRFPNLTVEQARQTIRDIKSHSFEDAPVVRAGAGHEVLLFEPGSGINPAFYSSFCEDLASHGYVIVGIAPTGWFLVTLPDGRRLAKSSKLSDDGKWIKGTALPLWSGDLEFGLDEIQRLNSDSKSLFYKRLDTRKVGAFGHSFGGTASIFTALKDDRVLAVANLDGSLFGILDDRTLPRPLLAVIHDSSPQYEPRLEDERMRVRQQRAIEEITQFYKRGTPGFRITITAAKHITFSDATALPPWAEAGDEKKIDVIREYLSGFFDKFLRGKQSTLLEQAPGQYGIAELQYTTAQ
jgi:hypothetical protein